MTQPATPAKSSFAILLEGIPFGRLTLWLLLSLSFLPDIHPPDIDLDPSWRLMLGYALDQNLQFGRDFVFTYGPLGFLITQIYSGQHFGLILAWNLLVAVACAWAVLRLIRPLPLSRQVVVCLFCLLLLSSNSDQLYMSALLLLGLNLLRSGERPGTAGQILTAVVLAVFSLIKFTHCLLSLLIVATIAGEALLARRRGVALRLAAIYGATIVVLWIACRQNPLNLPAYFLNSLEISRGYNEAMGIPTPNSAFMYGLVAVVALALYGLLTLAGSAERRTTSARLLLFAAATYLAWKHGFVRADGHMMIFYIHGLLAVVLHPLLLGPVDRYRGLQLSTLSVAGLSCFLGIYLNFPLSFTLALQNFNSGVQQRFTQLVSPSDWQARLRKEWDGAAKLHRLDRTGRAVQRETIDVLSHFQGVALLNEFNFLPRPVPQGYSTYTPKLGALNQAHYDSDRAPAWLLQHTKTIDDRYPTLDDAGVLLSLVRNYTLSFEDRHYIGWQRCSPDNRFPAFVPTPGSVRTARLGESIALGDLQDKNLWASLQVRPSLLGRLRSFFYKPAPLKLEIIDNSGRTQEFRLLREVAADGFLLNPVLRDGFDWIRFLNHVSAVRIVSLRVLVADEDRRFYQEDYAYRLDTLPAAPRRQDDKEAAILIQTGGFQNLPVSLNTHAPLGPIYCGGKTAVLVHAPAEMVFNVGAGATEFRASYGIADGSYQEDARTAGAGVVVEWQGATGTPRILFQRQLDPLIQPADRGLHELKLDLTGLGRGTLVLRNTTGRSNAWAWTVWREVAILPVSTTSATGQPILTGSNHVIMRHAHFAAAPLSIHSANPILAVDVTGIPMIQAHAPSEIALIKPVGVKRLVGRFAMQEGTYSNGAASDGAHFSVIWKSGDDERVLFERTLDPLNTLADRGVHRFSVELDKIPGGGTIFLRTTVGDKADGSWDWTCWSDVAVGDPDPLPEIRPAAGATTASLVADAPASLPAKLFREVGGFKATPFAISALVTPAPAAIADLSAVQVHPPSTMSFRLGDRPIRLRARFGLQSGALNNTDGVDYVVEWQGDTGKPRELYRRSVRPLIIPGDREVQSLDLPLTGLQGGILTLKIECGLQHNSTFDWACWQGIEIDGLAPDDAPENIPYQQTKPPMAKSARNTKLTAPELAAVGFSHAPVEIEAYTPLVTASVFGTTSLQLHAPSKLVIPLPKDGQTLAGRFGLQDGSYANNSPTDGATFIIEWVGDNGQVRELFRQTLDPVRQIPDRGLHGFELPLGELGPGDLVFRTEPGLKKDMSSDWTCWQGITIK